MRQSAKTKKNAPLSNTFMAGLCLLLIGIIGGVFYVYRLFFLPIDQVLGDNVWFYTEVDLSRKNLSALETHLGSLENLKTSVPSLHETMEVEKLSPWVKSKIALGLLNDGQYVAAAKYRNKALADDFMNTYLLPGEQLTTEEASFGTVYTPAYSSQIAFVYTKGWLIWADSNLTLLEVLATENKLDDDDSFDDLSDDLPSKYLTFSFVNLENWDPKEGIDTRWSAYRPLIDSFQQVIPSFAVVSMLDEDKLTFRSKALAHEGVYNQNNYKISNQTVPDLAYFVPKETLLFTNGAKVYDKYQHTKEFLTSLDPQLALVFEGVIKAQSNEIFGEGFDYEGKVLSHLNQNYALALDFENKLNFGFVAQIESNDGNKEVIKDAILSAQARYEPVEEVTELPDGSERIELIAKDISTLPQELKEAGTIEYIVVKGVEDDGFSYAFVGPYFVFANNSAYLEEMLLTYQDQSSSLAENRDFRQSVLFDFESAESYSFVNMPKFFSLMDWITMVEEASDATDEESETGTPDWTLIQPYLRNLVLSRAVYPGEVYMQGSLFLNQ